MTGRRAERMADEVNRRARRGLGARLIASQAARQGRSAPTDRLAAARL